MKTFLEFIELFMSHKNEWDIENLHLFDRLMAKELAAKEHDKQMEWHAMRAIDIRIEMGKAVDKLKEEFTPPKEEPKPSIVDQVAQGIESALSQVNEGHGTNIMGNWEHDLKECRAYRRTLDGILIARIRMDTRPDGTVEFDSWVKSPFEGAATVAIKHSFEEAKAWCDTYLLSRGMGHTKEAISATSGKGAIF